MIALLAVALLESQQPLVLPVPPIPRGFSPATPAAIAAATIEGDKLMHDSAATDTFVNVTKATGGPAVIVLRHRASGFNCWFKPHSPVNRVELLSSITDQDGVRCISDTITSYHDSEPEYLTIEVFRANKRNDSEILDASLKSYRLIYPNTRSIPSAETLSSRANAPHHLSACLKDETHGMCVVVGHRAEWAVLFQLSGGSRAGEMGFALSDDWIRNSVLTQ